MEEDVEEVDEEMDMGEAPPNRDSAPEQVPAPPATLLVVSGIWAGGSGDQLIRQGPAASSRAQGKAPAIRAE